MSSKAFWRSMAEFCWQSWNSLPQTRYSQPDFGQFRLKKTLVSSGKSLAVLAVRNGARLKKTATHTQHRLQRRWQKLQWPQLTTPTVRPFESLNLPQVLRFPHWQLSSIKLPQLPQLQVPQLQLPRSPHRPKTVFQNRAWFKAQHKVLTFMTQPLRFVPLPEWYRPVVAAEKQLKSRFMSHVLPIKNSWASSEYHGLWRKKQAQVQKRWQRGQRRLSRLAKRLYKNLKWLWWPFTFLAREFPVQVVGAILMSAGILLGAWGLYDYVFRGLPTAADLVNHQPIVSTKILDRNGQLLYSIYKDENRTVVPLSEVPQHVVNATVAIEDKDFYHHNGFSLKGIIRAAIANSQGDKVQGGSTITQQLVKNTLLSPERTLQRKIREVLLAVIVDASFSKEQILEMYFNEIPYGGETYGIEEAAQRFYGKSATELTLAEGAFLAGLPAAPTAYSPFGPTPELAYGRQREVLRRMVEDNYITQAEADEAAAQPLTFSTDRTDIQAAHFVMYVRQLLAERYGDRMLTQGGLVVRTSLDLNIQTSAEQAVNQELERLKRMRVSNGAALVTNPNTGEILAMVGSRDYFDFAHDGQVNVTLRPRQPGSSIKPLTYATAMELGLITPSTLIDDNPVRFDSPGSAPYVPKNYDGKYHGRVTVRESLGSSYNIPAVKTLAQVGVNTVIDKGEKLGITTWQDRQRFGLSLTLGGGEVRMIDMAQLYSSFATYGYAVAPNPLLEVTNYKGELLYRNDCALDQGHCFTSRQLDARVAYQITDILKDNQARTPAFGPQSVLNIPNQEVAVKTGTTNSLRDNWTIGYTSQYLVATWVGNNDNSPMSYVASGITGASPIWNTIMRSLLSETSPHRFPDPQGLKKVTICKATGTLPCTGCPRLSDEWFIPGTEPTKACNPAQFAPKPSPNPNASGNTTPGTPTTPGTTSQTNTSQQRDRILDGTGI